MIKKKKNIRDGIYLIIDPSMDESVLLHKLEQTVKTGIVAVQIWDNFKRNVSIQELIKKMGNICRPENIPLLINNQWQLLLETDLDGVHFDHIPDNYNDLKNTLKKESITGITCGNDLSVVQWAEVHKLDYISFCSMFPSSTANSCELVTFKTVQEARKITSLPIFLAGGIRPENMDLLTGLDYSGIAVVSGIMSAGNPAEALNRYREKLK